MFRQMQNVLLLVFEASWCSGSVFRFIIEPLLSIESCSECDLYKKYMILLF